MGIHMDSEKGVIVEIADDWEIYSQAWHSAMRHFYWYQESPVFDFNKDEEIDGMHSDFGKQGNIFLVARAQDHDGIVGVLGLRYGDIMARFRRWEPAVIPDFQRTGVAKVMLKQALEHLAAMGVKRAVVY
jgi:ribosomal protein S18 acetylase RimI-like enzyme